MSEPNPILKRVHKLSAQWGEFTADDAARVLVWQVRADEVRMVDGFLALESEQGAGDHRDVFHAFESAFEDAATHGLRLCSDFAALYRDGTDVLREQGARTDWEPPALLSGEHDLTFLIRTCLSFRAHYKLPGAFVLLLRPRTVADAAAYQVWLLQLALALPTELRVLLPDSVEMPSYEALISAEPERVVVLRAELDMPGALAEISAAAGGLSSPLPTLEGASGMQRRAAPTEDVTKISVTSLLPQPPPSQRCSNKIGRYARGCHSGCAPNVRESCGACCCTWQLRRGATGPGLGRRIKR